MGSISSNINDIHKICHTPPIQFYKSYQQDILAISSYFIYRKNLELTMKPNTEHYTVDNITQRLNVLAQRVDQLTKGQRKFSRSRDKTKITSNSNPSNSDQYSHFKKYASPNNPTQTQGSSISLKNQPGHYIENSTQKSIDELTKKVNNLGTTLHKNTQFLETEVQQIRQQLNNIVPKNIELIVPKFSNQDQETLNDQILGWLDIVINNALDTSNYSRNRAKNLSELQVSFSQHIITNILKLNQQIPFTPQLFCLINSHLRQKTLPYLLQKYSKKSSLSEINKIGEILVRDQLYNSQYDLCRMSGIDFSYKDNGDYNKEIMKFLNYAIEVPNIFKQVDSYYQTCSRDIMDILQKIQIQSFGIDMFRYNHTTQKNEQIPTSKYSYQYPNIQQIQYKQKIKSYTKYLHHKNSLNTSLYSKTEIQKGILTFKNDQILKFVSNWCQELQKYFYQNVYFQKSNLFRMKNSSHRYLKVSQLNALQALFNKQKKHLKQQTKELLNEIYQSQSQSSQKPLAKQLKNLINNEGKLGQFVSTLYKKYQAYLIKYLNILIHGINRVLVQYEKFQRVQRQYPSIFANFVGEYHQQKSLKKAIKDTQNFLQYLRQPHKCLSQTPSLITFHRNDTLTFECISKQSQIYNLYKYFEYQSSTNPKFLKILKVVDTLSINTSPESAITLNLLYKQSFIVEIKLSLAKIRYNHQNVIKYYIKGLMKEQFGPIMGMCVNLAQNDAKSKYFLNVIDKNIRQNIIQNHNNYSCMISPPQQAQQPQSKLSSTNHFSPDPKYRKLNLSQTHQTQTNSLSKNYPMLQYVNLNKNEINQINSVDVGNWASTLKQLSLSQNFLNHIDGICWLGSLVSLNLSSNRILQISNSISNLKRLQKLDLSKNNLITLNDNVNNLDKLKILNLQDNKIETLPTLHIKSLIQLNIGYNNLSTIPEQIDELENLKELRLNNNRILQLPNKIGNLTQLQILNISYNSFKKFPNVCAVQRLKQLDISYNSVSDLVQDMAGMTCLKLLNVSFNKINSIQCLHKLSALQLLNASFNEISHMPESVCSLENLNSIDLSNNSIANIPHYIGNIKKLTVLNLRANKITTIPQQLSKLLQLTSLNLSMNLIHSLPTNFINLKNLQKLNLSKNYLQGLPASFDNLANLTYFNAQRNSIQGIPEEFKNLRNLKHVFYIGNKVKTIPENLLNLTSLQTLQISTLSIDNLPKILQSWHSLEELYLQSVQKQKSQKIQQIQSVCSSRNIEFEYSQVNKNKFQ